MIFSIGGTLADQTGGAPLCIYNTVVKKVESLAFGGPWSANGSAAAA